MLNANISKRVIHIFPPLSMHIHLTERPDWFFKKVLKIWNESKTLNWYKWDLRSTLPIEITKSRSWRSRITTSCGENSTFFLELEWQIWKTNMRFIEIVRTNRISCSEPPSKEIVLEPMTESWVESQIATYVVKLWASEVTKSSECVIWWEALKSRIKGNEKTMHVQKEHVLSL